MAQPGNYTPILLYGSSTPTNVPLAANLTNSATGSEIAINVADKNLFFKDSGGVVNTVPIRQSSTSSNGWLSSTDWNTFNGKAPATSGTSILYGNGSGGFSNVTIGSGISFAGGTLSATGTGGTVTSVAALTIGTTGTDLSSTVANGTTTPVITLNVPTASAANRGALSAADWSTFNGKQAALVSGTNIKTVGGVTLLGSGDVGTIGVGYGGTGLTAVTAGYIPFGSSSTALATSVNLFWSAANNRLGINNSSPAYALDVTLASGAVLGRFSGPEYSQVLFKGGTQSCYIQNWNSISVLATSGASPLVFGTNSAEKMRLFDSGGVSIGNTTDPGAKNLSVSGTTVAVSELSVRSTALDAKTTLATQLTTVGTSATIIAPLNGTWGHLAIVTGLDTGSGGFFTDLVFSCVTAGPTVLSAKAVSGSPAARTYSMSGSGFLQLAMASGSYETRCAVFYGLA